jgi:hypothetical protein
LLEEFLLIAWALLDGSALKKSPHKFLCFFSTSSFEFRRKRRQKGVQQFFNNARKVRQPTRFETIQNILP